MMHSLKQTSIQFVKGVGPARKKMFERLGVETVEDLLYFFPKRYEDRRHLTAIAQLQLGEYQTVSGKIIIKDARRSWYTKKHVTQIAVDDGTGQLDCVWFNQPYLANYFQDDRKIVCYGKVGVYKSRLQMVSPEYEIIENEDEENLSTNRIVPVYALTRGMTQRYLRKISKACLDKFKEELQDELPIILRNKYRLYNLKRSIQFLHFPDTMEDQENALKRVSFEEFFFFQVSVILRRQSIVQKQGIAHGISDVFMLQYVDAFSYPLTGAQKRVIREIAQDMRSPRPMLRLLQGDVGCGKTNVALFGCLAAVDNGYQSCIMAPTEILARQHYENISRLLSSGSFKVRQKINPVLLTSSTKEKEKEKLLADIKKGDGNLVIGTHALINEEVQFKNLSFCVIDEQHKFGVRQRSLLAEKGSNPDILIMTATPIPRTLCITLYGDLDISVIDELPPGRGKITTKLFPEKKAAEVYSFVRKKVQEGKQAYIVYPIIEESETKELKAAQVMCRAFKNNEFKDLNIALLHGQLKQGEAGRVMQEFHEGNIDILIATTVLEVGVDIPNANVMVIEHADQFGLAQLHQLRGRIGRGKDDAWCLLIADPRTEEGQQRMEAILSTTDGFKIAQRDLEIRGPGQFFGRQQHGLNELKVANPDTQLDILQLARKEAVGLVEGDPRLKEKEHKKIREVIVRRYPTYLNMVKAG